MTVLQPLMQNRHSWAKHVSSQNEVLKPDLMAPDDYFSGARIQYSLNNIILSLHAFRSG
jgi:hypothetical protein